MYEVGIQIYKVECIFLIEYYGVRRMYEVGIQIDKVECTFLIEYYGVDRMYEVGLKITEGRMIDFGRILRSRLNV